VILVQAGPRVLPTFPEALSARAKAALEKLGIEVRLNGRVSAVDEAGVMIGEERIAARTVLWAAGVAASPAAKWLGAAADRAGRIKVLQDLSVPNAGEIFAIGDTALVEGSGGAPVPGLAPAARQAGEYVARVIRARIEGRPAPGPFRYRHLGSMATIGRKAAIAELGLLKLWGMAPSATGISAAWLRLAERPPLPSSAC
jgi:NADH dehydrogenase/putative oxidoreductase